VYFNMTPAIVVISVLAYLVALMWPLGGPIWIARLIKSRRAARREKPRACSEYDEP
jgi:hypothetical protein